MPPRFSETVALPGTPGRRPSPPGRRPEWTYGRKPRSAGAKRPRFGKIDGSAVGSTPNHFASVAPYWSTEVVGIQRPSFADVVGAAEGERRERPVEVPAPHGAAQDELVASPGVVGAAARVRLEGAAEVGEGEGRHRVLDAELDGRGVEGGEGLAHLREEVLLGVELAGVRVEAAEGGEEDLPAALQRLPHGDDRGDLLELPAEGRCSGTRSSSPALSRGPRSRCRGRRCRRR